MVVTSRTVAENSNQIHRLCQTGRNRSTLESNAHALHGADDGADPTAKSSSRTPRTDPKKQSCTASILTKSTSGSSIPSKWHDPRFLEHPKSQIILAHLFPGPSRSPYLHRTLSLFYPCFFTLSGICNCMNCHGYSGGHWRVGVHQHCRRLLFPSGVCSAQDPTRQR